MFSGSFALDLIEISLKNFPMIMMMFPSRLGRDTDDDRNGHVLWILLRSRPHKEWRHTLRDSIWRDDPDRGMVSHDVMNNISI